MTSTTSSSDLRRPPLRPGKQRGVAMRHEIRQNLPIFCFLWSVVFFLLITRLVSLTAGCSLPDETVLTPAQVFANPNLDFSEYNLCYYKFSIGFLEAFLLPLAGYLLAILQFSYLFNRRPIDVYGALPITRARQFSAKIGAGLFILWLPLGVYFTLLFLLNGVLLGFSLPLALEWLFSLGFEFLMLLIAYGITVWICTLVGTVVEAIFYPLILILAPIVVYYLGCSMMEQGIYGAGFSTQTICTLLFPFLLSGLLNQNYYLGFGIANQMADALFYGEGAASGSLFRQFLAILGAAPAILLLWTVLLAAVVLLARRSFLRRPLELAGVRGASRPLHVVMQWFAQFAAASVFFTVIQLFLEDYRLHAASVLVSLCAAGVTFLLLTLIIYHSLRCKFSHLLRCVLPPLCGMCLLFAAIGTQGFGIYLRAPNPAEVEAASIDYTGINYIYWTSDSYNSRPWEDQPITLTEESSIAILTGIQQQLIQNHQKDGITAVYGETLEEPEDEAGDYCTNNSVTITYRLKNGATQYRQYCFASLEVQKNLFTLHGCGDYARQTYPAFTVDWTTYDRAALSDAYLTQSVSLDASLLAQLQQAYQEDYLARLSTETLFAPTSSPVCYLELSADDYGVRAYDCSGLNFPVYAEDEATLALLNQSPDTAALTVPNPDVLTGGAVITVDESTLDAWLGTYSEAAYLYPGLFYNAPSYSLYEWSYQNQIGSSEIPDMDGNGILDDEDEVLYKEANDWDDSWDPAAPDLRILTDVEELRTLAQQGTDCGLLKEGDRILLLENPGNRYLPLVISSNP